MRSISIDGRSIKVATILPTFITLYNVKKCFIVSSDVVKFLNQKKHSEETNSSLAFQHDFTEDERVWKYELFSVFLRRILIYPVVVEGRVSIDAEVHVHDVTGAKVTPFATLINVTYEHNRDLEQNCVQDKDNNNQQVIISYIIISNNSIAFLLFSFIKGNTFHTLLLLR